MHQSLYCSASSIAPVFIASMSDYQSQPPKDKRCCCYDWLQQILVFKYLSVTLLAKASHTLPVLRNHQPIYI